MPTESTARAVAQLAETRQAIAQYWAQEAGSASSSGQSANGGGITPAISTVLAGLALGAAAEKLLHRTSPARSPVQDLPVLKIAQTLLRTTAQTHPVGLVAMAALLGGALVVARPWRWLTNSNLLPQLLTELTLQALAKAKDGRS